MLENPRPSTEITWNVIYMPGTVAALLPFALSLLQAPGVRVRLVSNGCHEVEGRLLRRVCSIDDRISYHSLATPTWIEHGLALNRLFDEFSDPYFAIVDSDVIASGDFMAEIWPMADAEAGLFTGSPAWAADAEAVAPPGCTFLGGHHRLLSDGTTVGGTYAAIYRRSAVARVRHAAPRGFAEHWFPMLPSELRKRLSARRWRFPLLDTARLIHFQLLLEGFTLRNVSTSTLHHVGGYTLTDAEKETGNRAGDPRSMLRALRRILGSRGDRRFERLVLGIIHRVLRARTRDDSDRERIRRRRRLVSRHVRSVVEAIVRGDALPAPLRTDASDVDARVEALVRALEAHYLMGLDSLRGLPGSAADASFTSEVNVDASRPHGGP